MTLQYDDERIADLLKYDPVTEAKRISAKSYCSSDDILDLEFDLSDRKNTALNRMLDTCQDVRYDLSIDEYLSRLAAGGFEIVWTIDFECESSGEVHRERYYILFRRVGAVLLVFDTYYGRVNGGRFYYNWKPSCENWHSYTSSGSMYSGVWIGYHNCHEAVLHVIRRFESGGLLLCPWIKRPPMTLLTFVERRTVPAPFTQSGRDSINKLTEAKLSQLPEDVQRMIFKEP